MFSFNDKYASVGSTIVDNQFILEYMPSASGDAVKVYLYGLMACTYPMQELSMAQICHDLDMEQVDVERAFRYWERVGLVERVGDQPPLYRYTHVNQASFLGNTRKLDEDYEKFSDSVYAVFGNDYRLHGNQIIRYYEWVEDLGLPQEVVLMILRYMISKKGKNFSYRAAEKVAVELKEKHVTTIEEAELAIGRDPKIVDGAFAVLRRFHLRREPTEDELNLYQKWIKEWHYEPEAILEACKETTSSTTPSFRYLDAVLQKLLETSHGKSTTVKGQRVEQKERAERTEALKQLIYALGNPSIRVNEGTLAIYDAMRASYDPEVILLAAKECARAGGKLEDVGQLLESWQKKNLTRKEDVEAYIQVFHQETEILTQLCDLWGIRKRSGEANHKALRKWMQEYRMSKEMIFFGAEQARGADQPMIYLESILKSWDAENIHDMAAAEKQVASRKTQKESVPTSKTTGRSGKVVSEQLYDQRPNIENDFDDIPEWLKEAKELEGHAQGNSTGA